jgi:hypothetical protein
MAADWTFDPGIVIDDDTLAPQANLTGTFALTIGGAAQTVYDLNGSVIGSLSSNAQGYVARFKADAAVGFINFGSVWQQVFAGEVLANAANISALTAAAQAAQTAAESAEDAVSGFLGGPLTIDSVNSRVGIGDPTPDALLNVEAGATGAAAPVRVETTGAAAANRAQGFRTTADSDDRLAVDFDGKLAWGSGGTGADVVLQRTAAGVLTVSTGKLVARAPVNLQTGTAYTAVAADAFKVIERSNAAANTLTIPANVFAIDDIVNGSQVGAGLTTIVAGAGMTLRSRGGALISAGQWAEWSIRFRSATEAVVSGDLV